MKKKVTEYSYAAPTCGHISTHHFDEGGEEYKTGYFMFYGGRVDITQYKSGISFSIVFSGRLYYKRIEGAEYTDLGLKRQAGKFGREVFKRHG
jgi:hypothetical protein